MKLEFNVSLGHLKLQLGFIAVAGFLLLAHTEMAPYL